MPWLPFHQNRARVMRTPDTLAISEDSFLGGALHVLQPRTGYRAGMDAVLLGASVSATTGQRVLDVGCGVGTASLCLARRIGDVSVTGLELQPALHELATQNAVNNGLDQRVTFVRGDVSRKGGVLPARSFDHVISNPPYIAETSGRRSGSQHADLSKRESEVTLAEWIEAMLYWVKERGHITIIHRADRLHEIIEALTPRIGGLRVCPVWPKPGREANRVVVQGRREAKAGLSLLPGITVRDQDDRVTPEMERIQRYGHGLDF
ncbi:MAG: methyltransferase [Geminicoccus sp.]|nr:methyltransferase [Geminicoccus sp.]